VWIVICVKVLIRGLTSRLICGTMTCLYLVFGNCVGAYSIVYVFSYVCIFLVSWIFKCFYCSTCLSMLHYVMTCVLGFEQKFLVTDMGKE